MATNYAGMPNMFMLKARSRVVDVPGVGWVLTRSLFIVAVMLVLLVSSGVAYAQGTPTVPTIESVAVTSDSGEDGGYAIGDEIQVGLTFSEAVTVTGIPQLELDVGGRRRTAEYSEGTTTTRLLFTYTVRSGDEDTAGIAVVANSLALNGGSIRAGSANAALTHPGLQSDDHKVDGIAPTVTVGGETRTYVPPGRQFNVVFYFSEKVYGITDAEIKVTNGLAVDVHATSGTATWPKYTRWDVIIVPEAEGPVSVTLEAGAATDAYGNGNAAPGSALEVIAANPVMVEVTRTTSGFAEGGRAEFTVTRSRDNGAIPVFLSVAQTGDLLSGAVEVYPPPDPNNPGEPVAPQELTFTETPFNLSVTFAAGETRKRIAIPTEDDYGVEDDGTVTLSVPARPDQYKYIPGLAPSATADVRDNDVPASASLYWSRSFNPFTGTTLNTALEGHSIFLQVYGFRRATGQPLRVTLSVTEVGSYLDLDGAGASGYQDLGNGKLRVILPEDRAFQNVIIPLMENDVGEADGSVTITIEPDPERSYTPSVGFSELNIPVRDNDTPSTVTISAPDSITEGGTVSYTLTRTWDPGQSWEELSVNLELAQTGDYITWPAGRQPDADGLVTIPVTFAVRSLTATLTLETVDDDVSEHNGSVAATIRADAGGRYVTGADSDHTTRLLDNDPVIISVSAVSAVVTEGTDAQFRFTRIGNTGVATRVGLYAGGLSKIMTDATEATVLTSEDRTVHIYGAFVDYILEFAAGETEKTLSFTTEADNVNEGDGWLGVTIVSRFGNPFDIGAGYAQVHVHDDDIPTVSFSQVTLPTGAATLEGDTWVGDLPEAQPLSWVLHCTGNYEYATLRGSSRVHLNVQVEHLQLANHPAHYSASRQQFLGLNFLLYQGGGRCDGATRSGLGGARFVGPDGGTETFKLVPRDNEPALIAEYHAAYREAKAAADAAGTLVTQADIIHPTQARGTHPHVFLCDYDLRYCPQYRVGTPHTISLNVINEDPTVLIKAEAATVDEGQPARFIIERRWVERLLIAFGSVSETVVALRASQNGEYITDALPTAITFAQNETRKIIELTTVDDSAFAADGSVTIELLPDTTGADLNVAGKYTTSEHWSGHTPEGGRSDRATVTITDNDNKPGVRIGPALGDEGDSGSSAWTFVVTLASATDKPVTVNYATSDGTATAGQDYTAVSNGSVTILAGDTTAEFDVSVNGDEIDEDNEVFNVTISLPSGTSAAAIIGGHNATALGLIVDDDPAVITVAPKADMVKEGEEAVFVLTRAGVIDNPLPIQVRLRAPGRVETLAVRFERGAATAELAVATEDNNLVDYPGVNDYTIELFGDGEPLDRDDRVFTPGDPATATVKVTDDDELINVTVHAVEAVTSWRNDVAYTFKRDGDISQPLSFQFYYYLHQPGRRTEISGPALGTFQAGQNEVGTSHINFYDEGYDSTSVAANLPWTLTYLVFGDGGWNGLNRIYQGGDPNVATVSVKYDDYERALLLGAEAPLWVSVGQTVSIPVTITNTGSVDSSSPISITSVHHSADRDLDGTNEPRMSCQLNAAIAAGQSAVCEVSFLVQEKDLNSGNYSRIELDVTASDGVTTSNTHRIYMRVMNGVSVGFTETGPLAVTEPGFGEANAKASLTVTRVGRSAEEVQVAYTLQPSSNDNRPYPPVEGVDYADNSATPGVITFGKGETEQTITIDILGDQIDEAKERFRVTLVPPEGVLVEEDKRTRIVVIEDATPPSGESYLPTASLLLVSADPTPENAGSVDFAIVLDRVWGEDARFEVELDAHDNLTATPAIATLGKTGDFEERLIHAAIPAGQTRFEFSLALYDDDVREEDETFQMLLRSSITKSYKLVGDDDTVLVTIADDDRVPPTEVVLSLSHNGGALEPAPEGSTQQDITVTASFPQICWPGDASNAPLRPADPRDVDTTVRVRFDPNSGATHAAGLDDFAPLEVEDDQGAFGEVESFDIVIPAGQTSGTATLRFRPVNDDVDEEDETVTLQGSEMVAGGSENSLPVRSASFTIIDDDARGITVSPSSALIGLPLVEGGEPGTYSLVPDSQPTDTVVITLAGNQGGFLRIVPDSITFTTSDWATPQTVSVMALDDGIAGGVPPTNFVTHQVSGGDYGSETVPNISAIVEDTTEAFVYLEGGQASESDGYVEFTVTVRPILRTTPVLVRYTTVDDTAIAGSDYTREVESDQIYKILTIPAGWTSGAIRIPITDDQVYESANETFTLHLTNHNNKATLDGGATSLTATGAITDDDPKPVLSVAGPAGAVSYVSETVKDPVTFTLTLTGQSAGDVTVDYATGEAGLVGLLTSRQGPAGATQDEDYTGISGTVTFTSGQTTKTVTVQVTDDDVSEETEFFGFKISKPQGADLRGQRSEVVADVGLVDDDARGVTIAPTSIGLDEPASGETAVVGSYTVNLKSRPTDTVTVTIGGGDPAVSLSGDTLTNNQLTFTTTTWNTAQTITVTPVKDDNAVGETVTLTHTLSGGDYAGIAADSVTINLTDSDTRNVVLSKPSLAVTEGDAAGMSYTVKLATQPSASVSVSITGHAGTDLTLSSDTLTFTVNDWDDAQTVTVKAGQDDDAVNDAATLTHTASGGDYANLTADLPVTVTDNDTPAIVFSETRLAVTEGDAVGMRYTVALATQPTSSVSVSITGHSGTDLTLSSDTLTFTVNDWDDAQTVTVKAGQDDDTVNDTATLTHTASGGDYANLTADLPVTVTDNDTAGVTIEPAALSVVAGRSNEYTVALATQPTGDVTVTISGHASTAVSLSGDTLSSDTLTFTVGNWSMAQTVTVSATQSAATGKVTLAHAVAGADYASVTADSVVVSVVAVAAQQPTIQVGVSSLTQTLTVPEGGSNSYTLVLSSRPTGDVSIGVILPTGTDLRLDKTSLTFTTTNWDDAQTVTVTAAEDDDGVTDAVATLTHIISGGGHGSTTVPNVEVSITENDTAGIVISKDILTVGEGDAAGMSYTVKLATQPSDSVSVSITGHADTDLRLDKTTLTFIVNDWDTPQTVTVEAGQDDDTVNDIATLTHTASGADYVNLTKDLPVTVTDAGDPQVTVKFGADTYTVSEGNTATITITLSADPKSTVIIPLEATGQNGATSDDYHVPSSVTINGGEMSKTFQFMAMADDASDDGESVMIGFGTNLPSRVTKGIPEETMVSIRQMNPQLGSGVTVQFEADAYTVSEGGTATITVTLSADPQSTVVIPITATNQGGATSADYVDVPASVTFNAGKTLTSFNFMATQDDVDENCECVLLTFGALPSGVTAGPTDEAKVSIIDNSTPNGPPTVPPGPFDLTAYGGDQALYVQWETPAAEEERAPVTSYLLRYRQVGTSSWRNVSRANVGLRLREEITGLTNRSAYEVQVAAVNRMGTGAWASVKGTPQAPYALPPGPEGDEALDLGRLGVNWLHPAANGSNVLKVESCTGAEDFRVIWTGPQGNRSADEWAVHINTRGGAGEVSYSITPRGDYFEMNGTANFEGDGALSLSVRGRFGSAWGTWWSPPVSIYCHEPEAPADTCDLQVQQQAVENTLAEGEPRINGIPESGQTLSADTRGITDDDGLNDVVFQYRWLADESEIVGATVSTYTLTSDDEGRAITVRVDFTDDAGHEESVTSAPNVVTSAGLELRSATVDGAMLTLTYNEVLDNLVSVLQTAFAVNVNGDPRSVGGVGFGESNVLLFLSSAVEAGDTVTVGYTAPDDTGFIQDILGRKADSFTGQAVTNNTDLAPLTASAHDVPSSHNGQDAFIFELRLSDAPKPNFSYTTVRDHAFTITGGLVTYVRRLEPGKNLRWEIHVTPGSGVDVSIALKSTTNCSAEGAICTGDGRMLSGGPLLVVPGPNTPPLPNTPAIGLPTISGTAQVGETLTADTTGISDDDGLGNATFAYQWLADDAEIDSATASTYTLVADEEGKAIKVRVSFTDDAGNDEELTSAGTAAVAAAPPLPNTPAIGLPTISGTAQVGETLTADTTGISDDDGLGNATFAYQWLADDAEINEGKRRDGGCGGGSASTPAIYTLPTTTASATLPSPTSGSPLRFHLHPCCHATLPSPTNGQRDLQVRSR